MKTTNTNDPTTTETDKINATPNQNTAEMQHQTKKRFLALSSGLARSSEEKYNHTRNP